MAERYTDIIHTGHGSVNCLAYSSDGERLYSCGYDGLIRVWNLRRLLLEKTFDHHQAPVVSLALHPDGDAFVSLGHDGKLVYCNTAGIVLNQRPGISSVANPVFTPDGRHVVVADGQRRALLWNPKSGECCACQRHVHHITALAVSPDGRYLVSGGGDNLMKIWHLPDGYEIAIIKHHKASISAISFSPDGSLLATCDAAAVLRIFTVAGWDVDPKQMAGSGHEQPSLAFTPDNRILATGSKDGRVYIFDLAKSAFCEVFAGHNRGVNAVAVSPDGKYVASGGGGGQIRIWHLKKPEHVA